MSCCSGLMVKTGILFICVVLVCIPPVLAFTARSLDITVNKDGDATAVFQYSLEGVIENAIPLPMLEGELKKGLSTSSEPPDVISFDRSGATLLLRKFAQVNDAGNGTEYLTASLDFKKAEIALKNSALNYMISADFSPQVSRVTFPDGYVREFLDSSTLPSLSHTVMNESDRTGQGKTPRNGAVMVNSTPDKARVFIDSYYAGETPGFFPDITPGQHTLTLERDGYYPITQNLTVILGETTHLTFTLSYPTPTPLSGRMLPMGLPGFGAVITGCALAGFAVLRKMRQ